MKKILIFQPVNDHTGSTRVISNIIEEEYKNVPVTVITLDRKGFLSDLENVKIIPICFPTIKGKNVFFFSNLIRRLHICLLILLHGYNHEVFYINTILPYYGAIAAKILKKKTDLSYT